MFLALVCVSSLLRLQNGSTTRNYSFDAWGRRRDADTWSYTLVGEPSLMASRGYTGHEHIEEFGLTNMNGRLYDPFVGRFLSADNYVQNPANSQNFNRYSYCLNNPLKYNDPSGDFIFGLTMGLEWGKLWAKVAASYFVGFDDTGKAGRMFINAWADFDPTKKGNRTNNAWRISYGSLFQWDRNRGGSYKGLRNTWEVASRFAPWRLPFTTAGRAVSHAMNIFGDVDRVDYFHGATVVYRNRESNAGVSIGGYINISTEDNSGRSRQTDYSNATLLHEYGHYLQARSWGALMLPMSAQSLISAKGWASVDHDRTWWEMDANARSLKYFTNYGYLDSTPSTSDSNVSQAQNNYRNFIREFPDIEWADDKWPAYFIPFSFFYFINNSN